MFIINLIMAWHWSPLDTQCGEKWCERYYLNRVRTPSTIIINQSPSQLIVLVEVNVGGTKIEEIGHPHICHIRPTTSQSQRYADVGGRLFFLAYSTYFMLLTPHSSTTFMTSTKSGKAILRWILINFTNNPTYFINTMTRQNKDDMHWIIA